MDFMPTSPTAKDPGKKGTKLRSTCDACKDAKVRCNRETPSCYRCRNQKLRCVYNLSRRMGRPRRNRIDGESNDVGEVKEHKRKDRNPNHWDNTPRRESATVEPVPYLENGCSERAREQSLRGTHPCDHSSNSSSNDARLQEDSVISSLMDPFGNPGDYDLNQLSGSTEMPDFDQIPDFDFTDGPGTTIASGPSTPNLSRTVQGMRAQGSSMLDGVATRDQYNAAHTLGSEPRTSSFSEPSARTLAERNLMLMDTLEQKPMSSPGDPLHSEILPVNGKHGFLQPTDCGCYENILQKLSDIDERQSDNFSSTIDVALMLEQWVQPGITQVLQCGSTCATKRPTLLLLLAIIIDNVVCMLENTSTLGNGKFPLDSNPALPTCPTPPSSSFRRPQIADMIGTSGGTSTGASSRAKTPDRPPLLVGSHEILSEEKNRFLKQLLQGRLSSLSTTLRQLMQYMQRSGNRQNSNSRHGTMMVADTYKKLQSIIGRVEMWEG